MSSGVRTSKPSDSPIDAAGIIRTRSNIASTARLRENLETAQSELRAVDGTLFEAVSALQRGLTLGTQGANATADSDNRQMIAIEIDAILRHLGGLANSVYDGRYVFAGGAGNTAPSRSMRMGATNTAAIRKIASSPFRTAVARRSRCRATRSSSPRTSS
ncbi:MAG: hypothetical protein R2748_11960 [Bryobacterales bacterium]